MHSSILQTLSVPSVGTGTPSRIFQAGERPMRIVIRNTGGTVLFIAHDEADVGNINSLGAVYQLPAGQSDVFVLAPKQGIFAAAQGGGGQLSMAASEAVPFGKVALES